MAVVAENDRGGPKLILDAHDDFRALFENAPDLMYMHDLTGILTRVNRAFERVTGYHREEAIGTSFLISSARMPGKRQGNACSSTWR